MKKSVKSGIIWGTTLAVAGGIAAAIAIPVVKAQNKVSKTGPLDGVDLDNGQWTDELKITQANKALENAGIADATTLTKLRYQLSFKLYDEEQVGSLALQRDWFNWDLYKLNKNLLDFIKNTLHMPFDVPGVKDVKGLDVDFSQSTFDALYNFANDEINKKTDNAEKKTLSDTLTTHKNNWRDKTALIAKLADNGKNINFNTEASSFDKVLLPLATIRDKQKNLYNEQKSSFISTYKGNADGNSEWQKQLSSKFGGATTEELAIDYLVNQQIQSSAFTRYTFKVNKDFTIEHLKSGAFADILGKKDEAFKLEKVGTGADVKYVVTTLDDANKKPWVIFRDFVRDANGAVGATKVVTQEDTDKVYFFGSDSKIVSKINLSKSEDLFPKTGTNSIMKVQNAILGFKQDESSPLAAWTVTKDQLTQLFTYFKTPDSTTTFKRPVDVWGSVFTTGQEELTKQLIGRFSGTTDATQWKSGNLGWTDTLSALASYVPGFSIGLMSALDDMRIGSASAPQFGGAVDGTSAGNALTQLMTKIIGARGANGKAGTGLIGLMEAKGFADLTTPATATDVTKYNEQMKNFITSLSDDEIKRYIGAEIRDFMMKIDVTSGSTATASQTDQGLPAAIKLGDGIYMVNNKEYGMHIVKVFANSSAAYDEMIKEFKAAAVKQDAQDTEISTNWGTFVSTAFDQVQQYSDILRIDIWEKEGSKETEPTNETLKAIWTSIRAIVDKLGYDKTAWPDADKAVADIYKLISSQKQAEGLVKIQKAYTEAQVSWLWEKIDGEFWNKGGTDHTSDHVITPDEIYQVLLKVEGI